jgi:NADPH:quinone reductase-like Zn-dependent oxidoreductase
MKAIVLEKYALNAFQVHAIEDACATKENIVVVRVAYAGVSFTDAIIALGLYQAQKTYAPLPSVIGFEFSGVVVAVSYTHLTLPTM